MTVIVENRDERSGRKQTLTKHITDAATWRGRRARNAPGLSSRFIAGEEYDSLSTN